jgi:hypothetical protein
MRRAVHIALAIGLLAFVGYSPVTLSNMTFSALSSSSGFLYRMMYSAPPIETNTLKASILNVTTDFNELSLLLQEFFKTSGADHSLENTFKEFLDDKAVRSHAHFEKIIDWVLTLFKIVFPFLAISILSKWSSHKGNGDTVDQQLQTAAAEVQLAGQFDDAETIIGGGCRQDVSLLRGNSGLKPSSSSHYRRVRGSESPAAGPSTPTEGSGMLDFAQRGASNLGKQHAIYAKTY